MEISNTNTNTVPVLTDDLKRNEDGSISITCKQWTVDCFENIKRLLPELATSDSEIKAENLFATKCNQIPNPGEYKSDDDQNFVEAQQLIAESMFWLLARLRFLDASSIRVQMLQHLIEHDLKYCVARIGSILDPATERMTPDIDEKSQPETDESTHAPTSVTR